MLLKKNNRLTLLDVLAIIIMILIILEIMVPRIQGIINDKNNTYESN